MDDAIADGRKRERDETRVSRVGNQGCSPFGEQKKRVENRAGLVCGDFWRSGALSD